MKILAQIQIQIQVENFRPDVADILRRYAWGKWNEFRYQAFKQALSMACGWDAPPHMQDQRQYELAIDAYTSRGWRR